LYVDEEYVRLLLKPRNRAEALYSECPAALIAEAARRGNESSSNIGIFAHFFNRLRAPEGSAAYSLRWPAEPVRPYSLLVWATNSGLFWVRRSNLRKS
jgi:hypothetical protein